MKYPVIIEKDGDGYMASFPDIPEALTGDDTYESTKDMALDALITAFEFYFEDGKKIPLPSKKGKDFVSVPASVASKVILLNAMLDSGITQVELAKRMGTRKQEIQRVLDIRYATKIDSVENALRALGKELQLIAV